MKIIVSKEELLKGMYAVQNIISPTTTLPILSNILLEAHESSLRLMGTDLDVGISCIIPVDVIEEGAITISAKRFSDIIKELPNSPITIIVRKNNFTEIECASCHFKLSGIPKDEFPQFPEFKDKEAIHIEQELLKDMLQLTSFAVSREETRYILNGILFETQEGKLRLVATDSRRLALIEKGISQPIKKDINIIVPAKAINELNRNLKEEGVISLVVGNNQVLFQIDDTQIASRLIEGEFPNYSQVIPKPTEKKMKINREAFAAAIRRANLLSTADYQAVKLEIFKNKLVVSKSTPDLGESREELEIEYNDKELIIGFNPHYLIDVLRNIKNDNVSLEVSAADKPAVLRQDNYLYLVLPMRL